MELEKQLAKLPRILQNGFEYEDWPILKPIEGKRDFEIQYAHWEFIPSWCSTWQAVKQSRAKYTTLNAVGENILTSKLYQQAALHRRCLVLSSGFYEWRHYKNENSKKVEKYPYFIEMADRPYFFMAGIWQAWTDKESGETIDTFAIVTTKANDLMEQIHNVKKRMPLILTEKLADEWLFGNLDEKRILEIVDFKIDSEEMLVTPLAKDFQKAEDPLKEMDYPELPPLL